MHFEESLSSLKHSINFHMPKMLEQFFVLYKTVAEEIIPYTSAAHASTRVL